MTILLFSVNSWGAWSKNELVVAVARLPVLPSFTSYLHLVYHSLRGSLKKAGGRRIRATGCGF